ncbi:MAG: hypothetical protein ABIP75_03815 [Pyrinomonadaceae bacterium]
MNFQFIDEPHLEFGTGMHVCPRAGISEHSVFDTRMAARRTRILVGAVGTSDVLGKFREWIDKCTRFIPGKSHSRQPNLFPDFCGFNSQVGFKASIVHEDEIVRSILQSDIRGVLKIADATERVNAAVEVYYPHIKFLSQNRAVDVIVCIIPDDLYNKVVDSAEDASGESSAIEEVQEGVEEAQPSSIDLESNFRRALKAKSMHLNKPLQLIREFSLNSNPKTQQDDASKAWNFSTALYYKANQTVPWKLVSNVNRPSVCFVGIGFYRSRDREVLNTSIAQIFDELGNGVILRGTPVEIDKTDRRPHLTAPQATALLSNALSEYRVAMSAFPSRIVIHKSSTFNESELEGFRAAATDARVGATDFVTILDTDIKLFRKGIYPPYRGTHIELDRETHLLYTRGAVKYYRTYTGLYIPQPLEVRIIESDESASLICSEILALTKMNWNNTQFDGRLPITLACAKRVGEIMKYLDETDKPQISYSYYM